MEGIALLLILLAVAAILSGPVALVIAVVALKRIERMRRELIEATMRLPVRAPEPPANLVAEPSRGPSADVEDLVRSVPARAYPPDPRTEEKITPYGVTTNVPADAAGPHGETGSLEQRIGTRWVLVAGVVTVVFAVGFFLKHAVENQWIGPWGRVAIAGLGGLAALAIGEITRRRGFDFVAKGVTALGFAILYATVFAAHRWYGLIGSAPAYALAIGVTAGAMLYAVVLDEVAIALLSLAGGYLTPILLSTGENLPNLLFAYVLILSFGAMLCAYRRKWSPVNILAFLGTYLLYTAWFERFYRPLMDPRWPPPQLGVAMSWLAVFFVVFLILPVLHTLIRQVRSQVRDTLLVLANAAVVFYSLWTMLMDSHRDGLALCSLAMGAALLGLMALVTLRCRADGDLRNALLMAALAFLSLAVPLYFKAHTIAVLWAVEAVALAAVGVRYRSALIQVAAGAAMALALGKLATELPLHTSTFRLFFNPAFGAWAFVAAALLAGHALYRLDKRLDAQVRQTAMQTLYVVGLLVLVIALGMELWLSCLNIKGRPHPDLAFFGPQMTLVLSLFLVLLAIRPLRPNGPVCPVAAGVLGVFSAFFVALAYPHFHRGAFSVFANFDFARAATVVMASFIASAALRRSETSLKEERTASAVLSLVGVLSLWILMTEEIWLHFERGERAEWRLPAHMCISILWAAYATALMVVGFWRRARPLRYVALGIFLLLLAKVFLVDTRTISTVYRIAGFLVTGLALVGVSYLYQYLRKQGFFETIR
jgi:uncharacterized membrane protein